MSKGFKIGQFIGIIVGVIAGHTLMNAMLAPKQQVQVQPQPQQQQIQPQPGVFEQALSK